MSKTIYNEGRVVGYSGYEIYVDEHNSLNPEVPPASEREWLSSSIASGSSLLLRYGPDSSSDPHFVNIALPSGCRLCAANTIVAAIFLGHGHYTSPSRWADRIESYGPLIQNDAEASPSDGQRASAPYSTSGINNWRNEALPKLKAYSRVVDGVVYQSGQWVDAYNKPPQKDFLPKFAEQPHIRLLISGKVESEVEILLTGFTNRAVISGTSLYEGTTYQDFPNYPADGDFLGPGVFPWANKITFTVPTSLANLLLSDKYIRSFPSTGTSTIVDDTAIIDMRTTKPETYYQSHYSTAKVPLNVKDFYTIGTGSAVLTTYQKSTAYPPAMYGTYVAKRGEQAVYPLDCVAPGTIKMINNASEETIKAYEDMFPGTHGMTKYDDGTISVLDKDKKLRRICDIESKNLVYTSVEKGNTPATGVVVKAGNRSKLVLAMQPLSGNQYKISSPPPKSLKSQDDNVSWAAILDCLANDKSLDILGDRLKDFKSHLPDIQSEGVLNLSGTGTNTLSGLLNVEGSGTNTLSGLLYALKGIKIGTNYVEFSASTSTSRGMRLYISPKNPGTSGPKEGDIGIGWPE